MTTTDSSTSPVAGDAAPPAPPLRPDRAETDRLAARVAVAAGEGRERHQVVSPLTGEVLGEVPIGTAEDVAAAFATAREAQKAWAQRPVRERAAVLLRYHDLVLE